jgi:phage baseplate assembly protein W
LTEFGSVPLFPNYGTIISSLLNNRINETTISQIKDEVDSGLKYVKSMNNANNETLNIDKVIGENFSIVDARTIQITLAILLTDGTYLQIIQPAMVK